MYDRLAAALAGLASGAGHAQKVVELPRQRPIMRSAKRKGVFDKLYNTTNEIGRSRNSEYKAPNVSVEPAPSSPEELQMAMAMPDVYARSMPAGAYKDVPQAAGLDHSRPTVSINPNVDRIYAAKALGQSLSQQSGVGSKVNQVRTAMQNTLAANPNLAKALILATGAVPAVYSAAVAGDEDTDEALALASIPALPALIDEGIATANGINIHNKAGFRMNMGQRGKLAGNMLSYLAPAIIAGTSGNMIGNILDEDIPT